MGDIAMLKRLTGFLAKRVPRLFRRHRYAGLRIVERMSDVPVDIGSFIYLVERNGQRLWVVLECPCRKGHKLSVSLQENDRPHWKVTTNGEVATIQPSLWLNDGCRSHFWITRNEVSWVREYHPAE